MYGGLTVLCRLLIGLISQALRSKAISNVQLMIVQPSIPLGLQLVHRQGEGPVVACKALTVYVLAEAATLGVGEGQRC